MVCRGGHGDASTLSGVIRLIATDLDGTLLSSAIPNKPRGVSERTRAALLAARNAGAWVVPASGRQVFSIADVLDGTGLADDIVMGANGAIAVNRRTGDVLFERLVQPDAQAALYAGLVERYPGVRCVSVRDGGVTFVAQQGYVGFMDPGDHGRADSTALPEWPIEVVVAEPSVKFVVRDPRVPVDELLAYAQSLDVPGCTVVTSGAPFVEVSAADVNKGTGLAELCGVLGVEAAETMAFGDELNDLDMIAWAGHGVAMANGCAEAKAVAAEVCPSNVDDGLAQVIERELAAGTIGAGLQRP